MPFRKSRFPFAIFISQKVFWSKKFLTELYQIILEEFLVGYWYQTKFTHVKSFNLLQIYCNNTHIRLHILIPGPSFYVSGEGNNFKKETVVVSTDINILLQKLILIF
jgi:hypothetical protein